MEMYDPSKAKEVYIVQPDGSSKKYVPEKHGKWTQTYASWSQDYDTSKNIRYRCSECKGIAMWDTEYCPFCGAKMDKE